MCTHIIILATDIWSFSARSPWKDPSEMSTHHCYAVDMCDNAKIFTHQTNTCMIQTSKFLNPGCFDRSTHHLNIRINFSTIAQCFVFVCCWIYIQKSPRGSIFPFIFKEFDFGTFTKTILVSPTIPLDSALSCWANCCGIESLYAHADQILQKKSKFDQNYSW